MFFIDVAKLNTSVPFKDLPNPPHQVFIYQDVMECEGTGSGSGDPFNSTNEFIPGKIYFAMNKTSERLIAVEVTVDCVNTDNTIHYQI